jgi:hypothetical protein
MSNTDDTNPEPRPTVRFRQLLRVGDAPLLALSDDGVIYQQDFSVSVGEIWRRLPTVSSTELELCRCTYPGCDCVYDYHHSNSPSTRDRCAQHPVRLFP